MNIHNCIPAFIVNKRNSIRNVVYTALFALAFINMYRPFNINYWFGSDIKPEQVLIFSTLAVLAAMLILVVTRTILYTYNKKKRRTTIGGFALLILSEIVMISIMLTTFEVLFIENESRPYLTIFKAVIQDTSLVFLIPYTLLFLYFSWQEKDKQIQALKDENQNFQSNIQTDVMVSFKDETGVMRISIKLKEILYIKAADNYSEIYYINNKSIKKYVIRNSIRNLEKELADTTIRRCHRSYMVNNKNIKVIERNKDALLIKLDCESDIEIPVSKTYVNDFLQI